MAEDSDLERTEQASPRRLEQAREEGHVPQSRELSTFLVLMAGAAGVWVMGSWVTQRLMGLMRSGLSLDRGDMLEPGAMGTMLLRLAAEGLVTLLPLFAAVVVAAFAAPALIGGWIFSPKALQFDFTRMSPVKGLGRMFSVHSLGELVKGVFKALVVGGIGAWVLWKHRQDLLGLMLQPLESGMATMGDMVTVSTLVVVSGMALIAAMDVPFQLWQYYSRLRMTKEEVRQEAKEMEGDPQVKARIRSQQREIARRRMMSEVPKADVIVTNPTHYAVALKYEEANMRAPRVVAKGMNLVAQKIREVGGEHGVPMLEAPPLARALYRHADIGDEIPATLYTAVAEVMAYVYQLNQWLAGRGLQPRMPADLQVPAGLDPGPA